MFCKMKEQPRPNWREAFIRQRVLNSLAKEKGTYAEGQHIYSGVTFEIDRWPVPGGFMYLYRGPDGVAMQFVPVAS